MKNLIKSAVTCVSILFVFNIAVSPFGLIYGKSEPSEQMILKIPIHGHASHKKAEFSGLSWYKTADNKDDKKDDKKDDNKDILILLPQYPDRFPSKLDGKIFAIPKEEIMAVIHGKNGKQGEAEKKLTPLEIDIEAPGLERSVSGYEGFEAIGFYKDTAFIAIESKNNGRMTGVLVKATMNWSEKKLAVHSGNQKKIEAQASISNACYETVLVTPDRVFVIYEGNGCNVNPSPKVYEYDHQLNFKRELPFPNIEYRITDATAMDSGNRFWCINYFWPHERERSQYNPAAPGPNTRDARKGKTHSRSQIVERLIEFQYRPVEQGNKKAGFYITDTEPIWLQLEDRNKNGNFDIKDSRNWEGIVRLDKLGFLIVTDRFPETILGFVGKR